MWLDSGKDRHLAIIWPHGYGARFDPLELIDAHGDVVAREGDTIIVAGGLRAPWSSDERFQHLIPGLEEAFVVQRPVRSQVRKDNAK